MIITRKQDYAIRILRALADGEKHSTGELCEAEHVPVPFGRKLVAILEKQNIVRCERGKYGGCYLVQDLRKISLYEFLSILEDNLYINACLDPSHQCEWQAAHGEKCIVHHNLGKLQIQLQQTLGSLDMYTVIFEEI